MKPMFTGETVAEARDKAAEHGLPKIDGKQALASARKMVRWGTPVNWYHLEDGTETVRDDNGDPAEWPT